MIFNNKIKRIILVCLLLVVFILSACTKSNSDTIIDDDFESIEELPDDSDKIDSDIDDDFIIPEGKNVKYVSPNGTGDYSLENPGEIYEALNSIKKNDLVILRGGTYKMNEVIRFTRNGTQDEHIMIYAYKNENVILDYGKYYSKDASITNEYNQTAYKGMVVSGNYYEIKGITIKACGSSGMQISGSYNLIENCVFAQNGNSGLTITGSGNKTIESWPSYNTILNCTSYGNYDWNRSSNQGEDADGFAPKLYTGIGNVFDGCISYNNSDDGYDLFTKRESGAIGAVTLKNCIAFNNGYGLDGEILKNGNGFKLGGRAIEVSHNVINCLSFNNLADGFCDNSNPGTITFENCTSYKNGGRNFNCGRFLEDNNTYSSTWYENGVLYGPIENIKMSHNVFESCISYDSINNDTYAGNASNTLFFESSRLSFLRFISEEKCNSKYNIGNIINASNPFVSVDLVLFNDLYNVHEKTRKENHNIYLGDFLLANSDYMKYGKDNKIGAIFK
ncbi:MAG: right-handed parallel beta-helix repeat-containing protein [Anaeroplasmataceae bacterium]